MSLYNTDCPVCEQQRTLKTSTNSPSFRMQSQELFFYPFAQLDRTTIPQSTVGSQATIASFFVIAPVFSQQVPPLHRDHAKWLHWGSLSHSPLHCSHFTVTFLRSRPLKSHDMAQFLPFQLIDSASITDRAWIVAKTSKIQGDRRAAIVESTTSGKEPNVG